MDPGTMMALMSLISGGLGALTGGKAKKGSTYDKNQLSALEEALKGVRGGSGTQAQDITQNPMYQQGGEWLNSLFNDQDFFNKFEAPARRQYEEETIPGLANRFASSGSGGSLGSTGFRNQAIREGSNLEANLAAMRGGMQQQGVNQSLQYAQQPVNNWMQQLQSLMFPTQNTYQPPSAGGWGAMAGPFASGAIQSYLGQPSSQGNQNYGNYASQGAMAGQYPGTY